LGVTALEEQQRVPTGRDTKTLLISSGLAILGLALAAVGIVAIFTTESDAGTAALLGFGALLLLFAIAGDRLESLRFGDLELRLRHEASHAEKRGDLETAKALRNAADTLAGRAATAAERYNKMRQKMPAGWERTGAMGQLVTEAKKDARAAELDREEILRMLGTGSEGARVWALSILQERPEFATPRAVLDAIERPDNMFDWREALLLGGKFAELDTTRPWQRERLVAAVQAQLDAGAYGEDDDCIKEAEALVKRVSELIATDRRPRGR
jgi:hypothetical protein